MAFHTPKIERPFSGEKVNFNGRIPTVREVEEYCTRMRWNYGQEPRPTWVVLIPRGDTEKKVARFVSLNGGSDQIRVQLSDGSDFYPSTLSPTIQAYYSDIKKALPSPIPFPSLLSSTPKPKLKPEQPFIQKFTPNDQILQEKLKLEEEKVKLTEEKLKVEQEKLKLAEEKLRFEEEKRMFAEEKLKFEPIVVSNNYKIVKKKIVQQENSLTVDNSSSTTTTTTIDNSIIDNSIVIDNSTSNHTQNDLDTSSLVRTKHPRADCNDCVIL